MTTKTFNACVLSMILFGSLVKADTTASASDDIQLKGVVCSVEQNTQTDCTVGEMKNFIMLLKEAKTEGEQKKYRGSTLREVGKGLVVVGGTWFLIPVGSYLLSRINLTFAKQLLSVVARNSWLGLGGFVIGAPLAAFGGAIMLFTESTTTLGESTISGQFLDDKKFGQLLSYDEAQILNLAMMDTRLASKIVVIASLVAGKSM